MLLNLSPGLNDESMMTISRMVLSIGWGPLIYYKECVLKESCPYGGPEGVLAWFLLLRMHALMMWNMQKEAMAEVAARAVITST